MKKLVYTPFLSFMMLFASDASANIHIKLTPIAVHADKVLFSTQKVEDIVGGSDDGERYCVEKDFGWLVVSATGIWDERNAYHYDCKKESKERYERYLQGKVTVKTPDKTLKELMGKYGFSKYSVLEKEPYLYDIKPKQSCFKGNCIERTTKQKTLGQVKSTNLHASIRSSFYYKGVALFKNVLDDYCPDYPGCKPIETRGASFDIKIGKKVSNSIYPTSYIDGLVIFDYRRFKIEAQTDLFDVRKQIEYCESKKSKHKMFKLNNAQWDICQAKKQTKIITINYKKEEMKYTESYVLRHGKLVYAFEQQMDDREGYEWIWNCRYAIVDEKEAEVISSLGHGKTEDDNWNPNEIIGMYKKRMEQMRRLGVEK